MGIQTSQYQVVSFQLDEASKDYIRKELLSDILASLNSQVNIIADTVTFSSSGVEEYKKIIEPIVVEVVENIGKSLSSKLASLIAQKSSQTSVDKAIIIAEYIKEVSNVLSTIELDKVLQQFMSLLRSKVSDEYNEKVVTNAIVQLLREYTEKLKSIISSNLSGV